MINVIKHSLLVLILIFTFIGNVKSSVVMTGTRVIFNPDQNEKNIQFYNTGESPSIIQIWVDSGDQVSDPSTSDGPFIATPQIFKINPKQGQMVRLIYIGDKLQYPSDRESLFYLNFSEIPSSKSSEKNNSKLIVIIKNRIKVLYRPSGIKAQPNNISKEIGYKINGEKLTIVNNSPYYANISKINAKSDDINIFHDKNLNIEPFKNKQYILNNKKDKPLDNLKVSISLINDYGVSTENEVNEIMDIEE